jgi:hypothetical protein
MENKEKILKLQERTTKSLNKGNPIRIIADFSKGKEDIE